MIGMILVGVGTFALTVGSVWAMLLKAKKEAEKAVTMIAEIQVPPVDTSETEVEMGNAPMSPLEALKEGIAQVPMTKHEWDGLKQIMFDVKPKEA